SSPSGVAPRTPPHRRSFAASAAHSAPVAHSLRSFAAHLRLHGRVARHLAICEMGSSLFRAASPLGLPHTVARSPLRRLTPLRWLTRCARSRRTFASTAGWPATSPFVRWALVFSERRRPSDSPTPSLVRGAPSPPRPGGPPPRHL